MTFTTMVPPKPDVASAPLDSRNKPADPDQHKHDIEAVPAFYDREEEKISRWQRILERFSLVIGQPAFLGFILLFAALWMLVNIVLHQFGIAEFDPAPFFWLQGIVGLGVLLTATVVLTEQKAAKLIDLLEKLRRDLSNVRDRNDPEAATLHQR